MTSISFLCAPSVLGSGLHASARSFEAVRPILEQNCLECHNAKKDKGDLRLDTKKHAFTTGDSGPSIIPGKPEESSTYTLTTLPADDDDIMPPKGDPLTKVQTDVLKRWIEEGAEWPAEVVLEQKQKIDFV